MGMPTVREIMTEEVTVLSPEDTIYEAAIRMKQDDIGFLPVLEKDRPVGTVTDRDLVVRGYGDKHSGSTKIAEVMTSITLSIGPDAPVEEAAKLMADKQVRRLLVMEGDKLVGVVALGDLAVHHMLMEEAGAALGNISEPDQPFVVH